MDIIEALKELATLDLQLKQMKLPFIVSSQSEQ